MMRHTAQQATVARPFKPTDKQMTWLFRAARSPNGRIEFSTAGSGRAMAKVAWKKSMLRLVDAGLLEPNAWDEFYITDKGRALVDPPGEDCLQKAGEL